VPFTLVHARKYRTEDNLKYTTKTKQNPEKANNTKHSQTTVCQVGLFYNAPEPTRGGQFVSWMTATTTG